VRITSWASSTNFRMAFRRYPHPARRREKPHTTPRRARLLGLAISRYLAAPRFPPCVTRIRTTHHATGHTCSHPSRMHTRRLSLQFPSPLVPLRPRSLLGATLSRHGMRWSLRTARWHRKYGTGPAVYARVRTADLAASGAPGRRATTTALGARTRNAQLMTHPLSCW